MNICANRNCMNPTSNPRFCSRTCSAVITNKENPKRTSTYLCETCGNKCKTGRKYCGKAECRPSFVNWSNIRIQDLHELRSYQISSRIRELARQSYRKSDKPKHCVVCGYDLHYEVCHLISIASFDKSTKISTVNDLSNLIALCPNHHWELDNGHLSMDDLIRLEII